MPTFQEVESDRSKLLAVFNAHGIRDIRIGAHRIEVEPQSPEHLWELFLETALDKGFYPEPIDYFTMTTEQNSSPESALVLIPSRQLTDEELAAMNGPISDLWADDESFSCGIRLQSPSHVQEFGGGYDVSPE